MVTDSKDAEGRDGKDGRGGAGWGRRVMQSIEAKPMLQGRIRTSRANISTRAGEAKARWEISGTGRAAGAGNGREGRKTSV